MSHSSDWAPVVTIKAGVRDQAKVSTEEGCTGGTGYVKGSNINHSIFCVFSTYDRNLRKLDTICYFRLNDLKFCVKVGHTCTVFMQLKCFN